MSLTFITGVKFYKNIIEQLNHITYVYDPKWSPDNSTKATLPASFFYVKNMHEVMSTEISQKTMLFYDSNTEKDNSTVNAGLLNVVADNIVNKPKTYKLDIIIPFKDVSFTNQSFVFNTETIQAITSSILPTNNNAVHSLASWSTLSQPIVKFYRELVKSLLLQREGIDVNTFVNNMMNQPDYNKNSLECMIQLRRIVKMKVWNSWEYKYVVVTDLDITKEGTEDGVYEATLTLQEMPIIYALSEKDVKNKFEYKNKFLRTQGKIILDILNKAEVI